MPRATRPPTLPPDLIDELLDSLDGIEAVADLLALIGMAGDPSMLRERTISRVGYLIGNEASRIRELLNHHTDP
jgi:hypothetical protein